MTWLLPLNVLLYTSVCVNMLLLGKELSLQTYIVFVVLPEVGEKETESLTRMPSTLSSRNLETNKYLEEHVFFITNNTIHALVLIYPHPVQHGCRAQKILPLLWTNAPTTLLHPPNT